MENETQVEMSLKDYVSISVASGRFDESKYIEMIYGIYWGMECGNFTCPHGERQAGCVIAENTKDKEIIANLVASDFLSQWNEYAIINNGPSIHIHHKVNGKVGGIALVLMYEEDME